MNKTIKIVHSDAGSIPVSLSFRACGPELIFFIHGLGCSQDTFADVWNADRLKSYSIITIDLPGFGETPLPDNFSSDLQEHAAVCRDVIKEFPGYRVHLVGHSMGGAIALLLSDMMLGRLETFVNVEGNLVGHDCTESRDEANVSYEDFIKRQLPAMIMTTSRSNEPGRRMWSRLVQKADRKGLYNSAQSLVAWSESGYLLKLFKELACRKIYIYGSKNSFLSVLKVLKGIRTVPISDSGHFPMNDNPEEFYQILSDFYSEINSSGSRSGL